MNIRPLDSGAALSTNPHDVLSDRVVIAMVGLPARGKSYISKAIVRYLNFLGCPAQLFNAGNKRRKEGAAGVGANFFDASNLDAKAQRERMAMETLEELLAWLHASTTHANGCACGILDATNTTIARREKVRERIAREVPHVRLIFLESICNDQEVLTHNYHMKLSNDDYKGADPDSALLDFMERVRQYERVYENVNDDIECVPWRDRSREEESAAVKGAEQPSDRLTGTDLADVERRLVVSPPPPTPGVIQMIDAGRKLIVTQCEGHVVNEVLSLLHSIHLGPRCIWITLVGETANDLRGVLGGDSALSTAGRDYAGAVRQHIDAREASPDLRQAGKAPPPAMVLTGTLQRNVQMAEVICAQAGEALLQPSSLASPCSRPAPPSPDGTTAASAGPSTAVEGVGQPGGRRRRISLQIHALNELCAGKLDELTYEQMRKMYPHEFAARASNKLHYRYPGAGGESYMDLIMRLQSVILMLEQTRGNVAVVADRAACRVLLAYFNGLPDLEQLPFYEVDAGVIELRRSHSGFSMTHTPIHSGATTRAAGPGTQVRVDANGAAPAAAPPLSERPSTASGVDSIEVRPAVPVV